MKHNLARTLIALLAMFTAFSAYAGAVVSGGQSTLLPSLTLVHTGGNIAPPNNRYQCDLFLTSRVQIQANGVSPISRSMVFTSEIPSIEEMQAKLLEASHGRIKRIPGSHPDGGISTYSGEIDAAHASGSVLLKTNPLLNGKLNDSNAASALIDLINANCSF